MSPPHTQFARIVLTGFMGSGKTTVGRLLAARLHWSFADLDDAVAAQEGLGVPEIFAGRGEPAFRAAEVQALAGLLAREYAVVALGGGAAATPAAQELLAKSPRTAVIHLYASFDVLEARCQRQALDPSATVRPLLSDPAAARERYRERAPLYAALAHSTVDVSTADAGAVAEEILRRLPALSDSSSD